LIQAGQVRVCTVYYCLLRGPVVGRCAVGLRCAVVLCWLGQHRYLKCVELCSISAAQLNMAVPYFGLSSARAAVLRLKLVVARVILAS
jgi:hypothetical protein